MASETYAFDIVFERAVITLLCSRPRFFGRFGSELEPESVATAVGKLALQAAQAHARDAGAGPDGPVVVVQRLRRWMHEGKVTQEQINAVVDYFDDAEDAGLPSEESAAAELKPIVQRRLQGDTVRKLIDAHGKREDLQPLIDTLSHAQNLGDTDDSEGVLIGKGSFAAIDAIRNLERLPIGVAEIDLPLAGGLPRKGLGVVVGSSGDGKSMFLSHTSGEAFLRGLFVAYATLELPLAVILARIKSHVTGVPINNILNGSMQEAKAKLVELKDALGLCIVKEFTPHATTVEDVRAWVKNVEDRHGAKVDLLVVDYGDKMRAPSEKAEYGAMRVVFEGLRVFAVEHDCWVWTASQASRGAKDKKTKMIDLQHVADSMHKVRVADLVLTLNVRDDGEQIMFYVAKNRTGKSHQQIGPLPHEFECGRIAPVLRDEGLEDDDIFP